MTVSLIAAVARNGVIGNHGKLPWRLPGDLARFRALTMGHAVIMGRPTFDSMGRPLTGRRNIVLSRTPGLRIDGCRVVASVEEAREAAGNDSEAFVIGGSEVYRLFLPFAHRLYLTWIDVDVPGDTRFVDVDWRAWRVVHEVAGPADAPLPHRFVDYERADR